MSISPSIFQEFEWFGLIQNGETMLCDCHLTLGKEQNQSMGFGALCFNPYFQTQLRNTAGPVGSSCLTVFHLVAMCIQGCACGAQSCSISEMRKAPRQKDPKGVVFCDYLATRMVDHCMLVAATSQPLIRWVVICPDLPARINAV